MDLQRGHFSVKMYAKMKELGPIGGVRQERPALDPPMIRVSKKKTRIFTEVRLLEDFSC